MPVTRLACPGTLVTLSTMTSMRIEAHAQVWHYGDPDQEEQGPGGDSRGG